ncbi:phospholipid carrier-dependent glycosyltransferase [Pseudoblastomonas halimionae]|uniref:Phospholipid carrier-dependent glycosyltransferase n=1 Tax=Alteriqipengyuania halimionae TaxID=1926630 RepID=A0A6I4U276_9SPHN|nr:glycosyltransferase family 39 protein [Alteriqipengyuania halimionae]MXP10018.1 phospholipid carrier-dependent glycosyltransferase [Alteriqipengyuania halimionae]
MDDVKPRQSDPFWWCAAIAMAFAGLAAIRLGIPTRPYFDEVHYVPAARTLESLTHPVNAEHPLLAKALLALAIDAVGDTPVAWRIPALIAGTLGLFAFMRMLWWATFSRAVPLIGGLLLATNFLWFVHARIAMLDGPMAGFAMLAGWAFVRGLREPARARWQFALAGVLMGLALGTKWSIAPLLVLPGLAFLWAKARDTGTALVTAREGGLVPGMRLPEAALWLGLLPLVVYWLTFAPAFFYLHDALGPLDIVGQHERMFALQSSVVKGHPYQSVWWQWIFNLRAIWYLYEVVDGAQRGIVLIGNPATMVFGLAALVWSAWRWIRSGEALWLAPPLAWVALMALWALADKPVQFFFHYMMPMTALIVALALVTGRWWDEGRRWPAWVVVGASIAFFAYFFPILTAAPLQDDQAFLHWAWWSGWR